jgi:flagellar hook protein FlgE
MGFQQGLSGLNGASKSLDAIGNNVANSNTVGFKASQAQFADVYASSLTGAGTGTVGIGTKVAGVVQQFTQGNITASNNPLDVAINGGGFFRMSTGGTVTYSRNGQFQLDKDGYIVNTNAARLTGYITNAGGVLSTGAPSEIQLNSSDLAPVATTSISAVLNLDSRAAVPSTAVFSAADPTSYNNATSVTIYDSLGNPHVMQTFFVKTAPGAWNANVFIDGNAATPATTGMTFSAVGALLTPAAPVALSLPLVPPTGATTPILATLDFNGTTQYGSNFGVNALSQNGFASGRLSGFNIGSDGIITGRYTNGRSAVLGQVVLANFTAPNGLQPLGNNVWAASSTSGPELLGGPGSGSLGVLQSSAVEDSNVDLTAELVNMITAQRVYQANAQTIKTQDQVLQTLVNLR